MTLTRTKSLYQRFLEGHEGQLHFAAHSHHFWPDVSREGHLAYWDDCALSSDHKWEKIMGEVIPKTQKHIARILHLRDPSQIVLAPNTHELSFRLLSCFLFKENLNILTTTSEFHSWRRQFLRLSEEKNVTISQVETKDLLTNRQGFMERLKSALKENPDVFFISQVFFDSGISLTLDEISELASVKSEGTVMVVDGYHGFAAIPTDLSSLEGKVFYLGGGYKYAQAGEGACFMVIPQGDWRPLYTGWFAEFGELSSPPGSKVGYTKDWLAFMGSTQDPSGWYRFNAVWDLFQGLEMDVPSIHAYVMTLQKKFLSTLDSQFLTRFALKPLYHPEIPHHGHFLTFESPSESEAAKLENLLKEAGIIIDRRGPRIRFGFGLYQDENDILRLTDCLRILAKA